LLDFLRAPRRAPGGTAMTNRSNEESTMTIARKTALSAALLTLGLAMGASAQSTANSGTSETPSSAASGSMSSSTPTSADQNGKLSKQDKTFAKEAAQGGMAEVQLGQLATQKAESDDVKQFGERMVKDHSKANAELEKVAKRDNIELPTGLDHDAQKEMDKLKKLSGADFDSAYMTRQVSAHKKTIKLFEKEAKSGQNDDLKSFASSTLPTLKDHLQMAQQTDAAIMAQGRSNTAHTSMSSSMATGSNTASRGTGSNESSPRRPGT
jgi:putative membrane protein